MNYKLIKTQLGNSVTISVWYLCVHDQANLITWFKFKGLKQLQIWLHNYNTIFVHGESSTKITVMALQT